MAITRTNGILQKWQGLVAALHPAKVYYKARGDWSQGKNGRCLAIKMRKYSGTIEAMPTEIDYYITEMKAGRLRIVYGLTTPQIWTVKYSEGQFVHRRYD